MTKKQSTKKPIIESRRATLPDKDTGSEKSFKKFGGLLFWGILFLIEFVLVYLFKPINVLWVWIGLVADMDANVATILSAVLIVLFTIAIGASIIFYKSLLQYFDGRWKANATLCSIWLFMIIVIVLAFLVIKGINRTNDTISKQATENANLVAARAADTEAIRELQVTIEYMKTQTAETTPPQTIDSIADLSPCIFEEEDIFPCKYWKKSNELFTDIAEAAYKNVAFAGRIAEFYRDEGGSIPVIGGRRLIIIPDHEQPQSAEYYAFYFGLLEHSIPECNQDAISFPCWLVSEGEPYEELAKLYPITIDVDCIRRANKTQWVNKLRKLEPKDAEEVGAIIVLPVCQ